MVLRRSPCLTTRLRGADRVTDSRPATFLRGRPIHAIAGNHSSVTAGREGTHAPDYRWRGRTKLVDTLEQVDRDRGSAAIAAIRVGLPAPDRRVDIFGARRWPLAVGSLAVGSLAVRI